LNDRENAANHVISPQVCRLSMHIQGNYIEKNFNFTSRQERLVWMLRLSCIHVRLMVGTLAVPTIGVGSYGMLEFYARFWGDETGGTAIEYALIASGIFLAIISVVGQVGTSLTGVFTTVSAGFH
jgi:pilus assembly protein Flp/PilA